MEKITYNNIKFYKIKDYPHHYISKCGKVLSTNFANHKCTKILKRNISNSGYYVVHLHNKTRLIHRLLGLQFIKNPENKSQINHKDGNKLNNNLENFEWCTRSENQKHRFEILNHKCGYWMKNRFGIKTNRHTAVKQYTLDKKLIRKWDCIRDIERNLNIANQNISKVCKGKRKTAGGFIWEYV